jgi:DNA-binding response OmpR family regulator
MSHKILYIEDEEHLAFIVKETLEIKGFQVTHLKEGTKTLEVIDKLNPDVCVLDVMLPYIDGFELGKKIRSQHPKLPVIFLTAKTQPQDVLEGFASGGTDFIKKPFSMEELIARITSQIQLSKEGGGTISVKEQQHLTLGSFTFIPDKYELRNGLNSIKLSNREAEILNLFCMHTNTAIDRRDLMKIVWGDDSYFISRNLDVYIRRLRDYFATGTGVEIITLKGKGYHFSVDNLPQTTD